MITHECRACGFIWMHMHAYEITWIHTTPCTRWLAHAEHESTCQHMDSYDNTWVPGMWFHMNAYACTWNHMPGGLEMSLALGAAPSALSQRLLLKCFIAHGRSELNKELAFTQNQFAVANAPNLYCKICNVFFKERKKCCTKDDCESPASHLTWHQSAVTDDAEYHLRRRRRRLRCRGRCCPPPPPSPYEFLYFFMFFVRSCMIN